MSTIYTTYKQKPYIIELSNDILAKRKSQRRFRGHVYEDLHKYPLAPIGYQEYVQLKTTKRELDGPEVKPSELLITEVGYVDKEDKGRWHSITDGKDIIDLGGAHFDSRMLRDMIYNPDAEAHSIIWKAISRRPKHKRIFARQMVDVETREFQRKLHDPDLEYLDSEWPDEEIRLGNRFMTIWYAGTGITQERNPNFKALTAAIDYSFDWYDACQERGLNYEEVLMRFAKEQVTMTEGLLHYKSGGKERG